MIAKLGETEFQGATKRNKPTLEEGMLIYARVSDTSRFDRPSITCISMTNTKQWSSGEAFFGELKGGFSFQISQAFAKSLLAKSKSSVWSELRKFVSFEVCVGVNGR